MTESPKDSCPKELRVGLVSYLNTLPLREGLGDIPNLRLFPGPPSEVAQGLRDGGLDLGLVPAVELLRQPNLRVVSNACIAAQREVASVFLRLRKPLAEVRSLVLDPHSRTSQILAQICLQHFTGHTPKVLSRDPAAAWEAGEGDAVLVIGDPALHLYEQRTEHWDLALAWWEMTGLPFVFAVWAGHSEALSGHPGLSDALDQCRDLGVSRTEALADAAAGSAGLKPETLRVYLRSHIRYCLATAERSGLDLFLELARPFIAEISKAGPPV